MRRVATMRPAATMLRRTLTTAALLCCVAGIAPAGPAVYDEFGRVPEPSGDPDLALPDPVLDRTWPMPAPGAADAVPESLAPDEERVDPFGSGERRRRKEAVSPGAGAQPGSPMPLPPRDDGSQAVDQAGIEAGVERDTEQSMEAIIQAPLDAIETEPSPLEEDEADYRREAGDPKEW